jgi:rfaE bifunctional protein kinase chain/domain
MKKTVFISGKFNVIHPGHLRVFKLAKDLAEKLIVGVESDALANGYVQLSEDHRLEVVGRIDLVDQAVLINDSVINTIRRLKPDIVLKGKEYEDLPNAEIEILKEYGGQVLFSSGDTYTSLDEYRDENTEFKHNKVIPFNDDFLHRHNISVSKLANIVKKFSYAKVCVIGDLIVDEYIKCHPIGMSQEDSTIVVNPTKSDLFIGGAGIVAAHAKAMGSEVTFLSVAGDDAVAKFSVDSLKAMGVNLHVIVDQNRTTTHKKRYRVNNQSMFRVNYFRDDDISKEIQNQLIKKLLSIAPDLDVIIFSDFNYGCLPNSFVSKVSKIAELYKLVTIADSQTSSQIGDITRFKNMTLITPTEHEARVGLVNRSDGLEQLCRNLVKKTKCQNIFLKLGKNGLLVFKSEDGSNFDYCVDNLQSLNKYPVDVSGAGDSMLVAGSLALTVGGSIWEASVIGSIAASIQVGRVGNIPITKAEMLKALEE